MAEEIARHAHPADHVSFASAGTLDLVGRPTTADAATVLREIGVEPGHHASSSLDSVIVASADLIYVMEPGHLYWVVNRWPAVEDRVRLLDPDGATIDDPYGYSVDEYRTARDLIAAAVEARAPEWGAA